MSTQDLFSPVAFYYKYDTLSHMSRQQALIEKEREKFQTYLTDHRLQNSAGRQRVFKLVIDSHGHFTAEEIVKKAQEKNINVSRATIYRSLRELLEAGVVRETAYGEKHQHFEHVYDEELHHHARCVRCGHILEFPDNGEEDPYRKQLEKNGFKILGHELTFYGLCKTCNSREKH